MEGRPLEERDLIVKSCAGDGRAFGELVRAHQQVALRVAYLVVRNSHDAEEVAQDAFVKAFRALAGFRDDEPFRPWLLRIVRNEALNRVRGRQRRERASQRLMADPGSGGAAPSPESFVVTGDDSGAILAAMDRLPLRYREVVHHRFLLGLSEGEVAQVLGMPKGTVKSRTSRGLKGLRGLLEEMGWQHE